MGTSSIVRFHDGNKVIVSVYHHYDGYISGMGKELAGFLEERKLVNGLSSDDTDPRIKANGVGCLAAQWISLMKQGPGDVYIASEEDDAEFDYEVCVPSDMEVTVSAFRGSDELFHGAQDDFYDFVVDYISDKESSDESGSSDDESGSSDDESDCSDDESDCSDDDS